MSNKVWDMQSYKQSEEVDSTLKVYECYVNGVRYIVAETSEDNVVVEGIDANYVWYNASLLTQKMSSWALDFEKVVRVMENERPLPFPLQPSAQPSPAAVNA